MAFESEKNTHSGHRQRLRKRFFENGGFDGFDDYAVLEYILFYGVAMKDTNPIAHALIDRFGSLRAVFDADVDTLASVDGVTPTAAALIASIPAIARVYEDSATKNTVFLTDPDAITSFISPKFIGVSHERLYIICLDSNGRLLGYRLISDGGVNGTAVNIRDIVSEALILKATVVILAHNHPFGEPVPSRGDIDFTIDVADALSYVDVKLVDHLIISPTGSFSFAGNKKCAPYLNGKDIKNSL